VNAAGSQEDCPTTSQEYHLRVVGEAGEKTHTLVLGVTGALPSPTATPQPVALLSASPSPSPTSQPVPATSPPPSPTPEPQADPSPSPAPGTEPPTSVPPSSSPTPLHVALVATSTTPTRVTQPTTAPSRSSSAAEPAISTSLGYITFNFTMIGLLSWLTLRMLRRR
jgi:flagellar biogenesis protein FliO